MPVVRYTTTVDAEKTVSEIQKRLSSNGARRIAIDYNEQGRPRAVQFALEHAEWGTQIFTKAIAQ